MTSVPPLRLDVENALGSVEPAAFERLAFALLEREYEVDRFGSDRVGETDGGVDFIARRRQDRGWRALGSAYHRSGGSASRVSAKARELLRLARARFPTYTNCLLVTSAEVPSRTRALLVSEASHHGLDLRILDRRWLRDELHRSDARPLLRLLGLTVPVASAFTYSHEFATRLASPLGPAADALPRWTGREDELARLLSALDDTPLVLIDGPGGMGKSRLALEAAARDEASTPPGSRSWLFVEGGSELQDADLRDLPTRGAVVVVVDDAQRSTQALTFLWRLMQREPWRSRLRLVATTRHELRQVVLDRLDPRPLFVRVSVGKLPPATLDTMLREPPLGIEADHVRADIIRLARSNPGVATLLARHVKGRGSVLPTDLADLVHFRRGNPMGEGREADARKLLAYLSCFTAWPLPRPLDARTEIEEQPAREPSTGRPAWQRRHDELERRLAKAMGLGGVDRSRLAEALERVLETEWIERRDGRGGTVLMVKPDIVAEALAWEGFFRSEACVKRYRELVWDPATDVRLEDEVRERLGDIAMREGHAGGLAQKFLAARMAEAWQAAQRAGLDEVWWLVHRNARLAAAVPTLMLEAIDEILQGRRTREAHSPQGATPRLMFDGGARIVEQILLRHDDEDMVRRCTRLLLRIVTQIAASAPPGEAERSKARETLEAIARPGWRWQGTVADDLARVRWIVAETESWFEEAPRERATTFRLVLVSAATPRFMYSHASPAEPGTSILTFAALPGTPEVLAHVEHVLSSVDRLGHHVEAECRQAWMDGLAACWSSTKSQGGLHGVLADELRDAVRQGVVRVIEGAADVDSWAVVTRGHVRELLHDMRRDVGSLPQSLVAMLAALSASNDVTLYLRLSEWQRWVDDSGDIIGRDSRSDDEALDAADSAGLRKIIDRDVRERGLAGFLANLATLDAEAAHLAGGRLHRQTDVAVHLLELDVAHVASAIEACALVHAGHLAPLATHLLARLWRRAPVQASPCVQRLEAAGMPSALCIVASSLAGLDHDAVAPLARRLAHSEHASVVKALAGQAPLLLPHRDEDAMEIIMTLGERADARTLVALLEGLAPPDTVGDLADRRRRVPPAREIELAKLVARAIREVSERPMSFQLDLLVEWLAGRDPGALLRAVEARLEVRSDDVRFDPLPDWLARSLAVVPKEDPDRMDFVEQWLAAYVKRTPQGRRYGRDVILATLHQDEIIARCLGWMQQDVGRHLRELELLAPHLGWPDCERVSRHLVRTLPAEQWYVVERIIREHFEPRGTILMGPTSMRIEAIRSSLAPWELASEREPEVARFARRWRAQLEREAEGARLEDAED